MLRGAATVRFFRSASSTTTLNRAPGDVPTETYESSGGLTIASSDRVWRPFYRQPPASGCFPFWCVQCRYGFVRCLAQNGETFLQRFACDGEWWSDFNRLPPSPDGRKEEQPLVKAAFDDRVGDIVIRLLLARLHDLHSCYQASRGDMADDLRMPRLNFF